MRAGLPALLLALCLAVAACAGSGTPTPVSDETIEIFGPYQGVEADRFIETLQPFVDSAGVDVRYIGSVDFVDDLRRRVGKANDPPDIAIVPQPGLIRQFAEDGDIVELSEQTEAEIADNYPEAAAALGRIDDTSYGVPFRLAVKSLVWYRPDVFAQHGWTPPKTLDELDELVAEIESKTDLAPWCFSMEAGTATGWTATDWVEDLVLRTAGPDPYQEWATGEVGFDDPEIAAAFDDFQALVLAPGRVAGGLESVVETPVSEALGPLFSDPPGCALYKQADFATSWMPDGTTIGADGDVDWFLLPGETEEPPPVLVGGDQAVQFRRDPDVDALMAYLAGQDAGESWVRHGGFLSPKSTIPEDAYPGDFLPRLVEAVGTAPALRFDASDQLPPDVGSGLLWQRITEWVQGVLDYPTFADEIDAALAGEPDGSETGGP
jgi:alpha-glucoside transport system substrate-binding protein